MKISHPKVQLSLFGILLLTSMILNRIVPITSFVFVFALGSFLSSKMFLKFVLFKELFEIYTIPQAYYVICYFKNFLLFFVTNVQYDMYNSYVKSFIDPYYFNLFSDLVPILLTIYMILFEICILYQMRFLGRRYFAKTILFRLGLSKEKGKFYGKPPSFIKIIIDCVKEKCR